ncbi:hypothetical protein FB45DRAFT_997796 [Roridomyces roridus]|uniref:Uncharacterized protein n=1 Tax=Roridomyces roridus TaxID=1738132 RepID=A0AAD7CKI4_9AGAR|nr:hypothetical protein FB45DRAFT_997796 [Roridomyces roridus]
MHRHKRSRPTPTFSAGDASRTPSDPGRTSNRPGVKLQSSLALTVNRPKVSWDSIRTCHLRMPRAAKRWVLSGISLSFWNTQAAMRVPAVKLSSYGIREATIIQECSRDYCSCVVLRALSRRNHRHPLLYPRAKPSSPLHKLEYSPHFSGTLSGYRCVGYHTWWHDCALRAPLLSLIPVDRHRSLIWLIAILKLYLADASSPPLLTFPNCCPKSLRSVLGRSGALCGRASQHYPRMRQGVLRLVSGQELLLLVYVSPGRPLQPLTSTAVEKSMMGPRGQDGSFIPDGLAAASHGEPSQHPRRSHSAGSWSTVLDERLPTLTSTRSKSKVGGWWQVRSWSLSIGKDRGNTMLSIYPVVATYMI